MATKRPHPEKIRDFCIRRGLFVMWSGEGRNFRYDFWDKTTGKLVLTYYPSSGRWMAGQRDGHAADYRTAVRDALGPDPGDAVSGPENAPPTLPAARGGQPGVSPKGRKGRRF